MTDDKLLITELVLTAYLYNTSDEINASDLPVNIRKHYWNIDKKNVMRPIYVTEQDIIALFGLNKIKDKVRSIPFLEYEEFGSQIKLTAFDMCHEWFIKQSESIEIIKKNPILAKHFEKDADINYEKVKSETPPKEYNREWIESLIKDIKSEKDAENMLRLADITAPEDVAQELDTIILSDEQENVIKKISKAILYREYLKMVGLTEIGKLLFVGPPGTGKTSTSRALSKKLKIPIIEVKLSQISDQYLGETAKNIDRIFYLAKKLNPCIFFIDEFDFIAKARSTDEHAAFKRAVNTLLKAIDEISLIDDGVLLIGATNHPDILDYAIWRRFDEIVEFPLPDIDIRERIFEVVLNKIDGDFDVKELSRKTEGCSGADIRLIVRDAVLTGLIDERKKITQEDILEAIKKFGKRRKEFSS